MFNFAPVNTTAVIKMPKRYLKPGMRLRQTLAEVQDPESKSILVETRDYTNPFWNLWTVSLEQQTNMTIYSDDIVIGFNAKLGKSNVTVSFKDTVTGVRFNITQPVEIIAEHTYKTYL